MKLFNTARGYWTGGYRAEAIALMCLVRTSFDRLSQKYDTTVVNNITRARIDAALAAWNGDQPCTE